jgi:hypothetical protein
MSSSSKICHMENMLGGLDAVIEATLLTLSLLANLNE